MVNTARHDLVDEQVWCPLRARDVDVERCLTCVWLRSAELEQAPRYIACRIPLPSRFLGTRNERAWRRT